MPLLRDTRLGAYVIVSPLGAGGMGEVYRARDTKLGRDVAIKILPQLLTADPDRLARFEREARVLASLNHPHIAAIYGIEESDGIQALVLELVEGETLSERLQRAKGSRATGFGIPIGEALALARQIVEALDAAHEKNIVHRDLKPANIALTRDDVVKVLDFGLAKTVEREASDESQPPTITNAGTRDGMILGTAAYMSPEQARGLTVDKRTDIWAFGCVLYELLTGRLAFSGATITDTLAAILEREPDWQALPPKTPAGVLRLLQRCLQKDPKSRLRDIADARLDLTSDGGSAVILAVDRRALPLTRKTIAGASVLMAVLVAAAVTTGMWLRPQSSPLALPGPVRFTVSPPAGDAFGGDSERSFLALSPDGSQIAFVLTRAEGPSRIWLRPVSSIDAQPVAGTEGAGSLFWSPNGRSLAFFAGNKLKRIELPNGAAVTICDVPEGVGLSGTWSVHNEILFASVEGDAIYSVPTAGGTAVAIVTVDQSRGEARINWPWFLPDGKRFVYLTRLRDSSGQLTIGERGRPSRPILPVVSSAQWVDPGYLVFVREGTLLGQRFDLSTERVVGEPFAIADAVRYSFSTARAMFTTSRTGTVAYQLPRAATARVVWSDRTGAEKATVGSPGDYQSVRLSPDAGTILFDRFQHGLGTPDLWTADVARGTETRLTSDPLSEANAMWLPDGRTVVFAADRGGSPHLFRKDVVTGAEEELLPEGRLQGAQDVWTERNALVYTERTARGNFDILMIPLTGPATPSPLLQSRFDEIGARVAPDGRAIAFTSNESGQYEVYVAPLPPTGEKKRVSTGGAARPRWTRDGRELIYLSADQTVFSLPIRTTPSLVPGTPTPLFRLKAGTTWGDFDVSRDGNRFLSVVSEVRVSGQPVIVVLNGIAEPAR